MPTILWGSLLGRAAAIVVEHSLSPLGELRVNPHAYALVGATAALAGTFRATISVVIIVLEGVGKSAFLFPLLIAVAGANLASRLFGASLYEEQLVRSNIPFLHAKPPKVLLDDSITALDVCERDVITFRAIEKVSVIEDALAQTTHNGFPILSAKGKRVIGVILRKQLLVLLSRRAFVENLVHAPVLNAASMEEGHDEDSVLGGRTPDDVVSLRVAEYCAELTRVMRGFHHRSSSSRHGRRAESSIIAQLGLTDVERERRCDLGVFMALSPPSIAADARARDAYALFTRLSLRHLCVVDATSGAIRGIITRHDLFYAARDVDRSLPHVVSSSSITL
jgi:chloride channel 7